MKLPVGTNHFTMTFNAAARIVRVSRTQQPFADKDIARSFAAVQNALPATAGTKLLLLDMRDGTNLVHPDLEAEFLPPFAALVRRFLRVAVLHHSAIGKLQIQRFARENSLSVHVFVNEKLAEAFIAGVDDTPAP